MIVMPKAFPLEFRRDVVAVARTGEASLAQIAKDFGVSESCLPFLIGLGRRERFTPPYLSNG
jgi:transposase-like protein